MIIQEGRRTRPAVQVLSHSGFQSPEVTARPETVSLITWAQYPTDNYETDEPELQSNPGRQHRHRPSCPRVRPAASPAPRRTRNALVAARALLRARPHPQVARRAQLVLVEQHLVGLARVALAIRRAQADAQVGLARLAPRASWRRGGDEVGEARERGRGRVRGARLPRVSVSGGAHGDAVEVLDVVVFIFAHEPEWCLGDGWRWARAGQGAVGALAEVDGVGVEQGGEVELECPRLVGEG